MSYVGIGTSNPNHTLEVAGQVYVEAVEGGNTSQQVPLEVYSNYAGYDDRDSSRQIRLRVTPSASPTSNINTDMGIEYNNGNYFFISAPVTDSINGNKSSFVIKSSGNIGIGTTNPNTKLHIIGPATVIGSITAAGNISTSAGGISVTGNITTTGGSLSTTGDITTSGGAISASGDITTTGGSLSSSGNIQTGGKIDAVTGFFTGGSITATEAIIHGPANITGDLTVGGSVLTTGLEVSGTLAEYISHTGNLSTKFGFPDLDEYSIITGGEQRLSIKTTQSIFSGTITTASLSSTGGITSDTDIIKGVSLSSTGGINSDAAITAVSTVKGSSLSSTGGITSDTDVIKGVSLSSTGGITSDSGVIKGASLSSTGTITGSSISSSGGITSTSGVIKGSSLSSTGSIFADSTIKGGSLTSTAAITAVGTVKGASLSSTGGITSDSGIIKGASLSSTAAITAASTIKGGSLSSTAAITATNTIKGGSLSSTAAITAVGTIKGASLSSTGEITSDLAISAGENTNVACYLGKAGIGYDGTNGGTAVFAQLSNLNNTNFALKQLSNGQTGINRVSGRSIEFSEAGGTAQMTLFSGGNLGIGTTTNVGNKLYVNGNFKASTSIDAGGDYYASSTAITSGTTWIGSGGVNTSGSIRTTGSLGVGVTSPGEKVEIAQDSVSVSSDPSVNNYGQLSLRSTSNYSGGSQPSIMKIGIDHAAGGYGKMFIQGIVDYIQGNLDLLLCPKGGSVGIGVTVPAEKLEVSGNILTSGTLRSTGSDTRSKAWLYFDKTLIADGYTQTIDLSHNHGSVNNNNADPVVAHNHTTNTKNINADHAGHLTSYATSTSVSYGIRSTSSVVCDTGGFYSASDRRIKKHIRDLDSNKIASLMGKLRSVEFKWKNTNKQSYGFIAQEVQKIFPELVDNVGTEHVQNYNDFFEYKLTDNVIKVKIVSSDPEIIIVGSLLDFINKNENNDYITKKVKSVIYDGDATFVEVDYDENMMTRDETIAVSGICLTDYKAINYINFIPFIINYINTLKKKTIVPYSIIEWYGIPEDIPEGYVLCDGTNDTPKLTERIDCVKNVLKIMKVD